MTLAVHIVPSLQPTYLAVEARLKTAGFSEDALVERLNEIAAVHFAGKKPPGVRQQPQAAGTRLRFGFDFGGHKFLYELRLPDELTIIDIRLGISAV